MNGSVIYFGGGGKYQREYDEIYDELEPIWDEVEAFWGKVFISACNIYYENYNNGNSNVVLNGELVESFEDDLRNLTDYFSMRHNQDAVNIVKKIYNIYVWEKGYNEDNDEVFESLIDNVVVELMNERDN